MAESVASCHPEAVVMERTGIYWESPYMDHIEDLQRRIARFSNHLLQGLAPQQGLPQALQTIPGLHERGAALLSVEIGDDMEAFGSGEKLASWAGVCPCNHESAGKRKGNPYVRGILCEATNTASCTRSELAELFKSLLIRRGRKRAIFALAHKILKIVFVLISRSNYCRDATVDYEAMSVERNAPRWIRMLQKYSYISA